MRTLIAALTLTGIVVSATSAKALMIAPSPISLRVASADAVVVGKVTEVTAKSEKGEMAKGDERMIYIATVKVEETIQGKKTKTIKVAYFAPPAAPAGGGIRIGGGNRGGVQLTKDQEGVLFLSKHPTKKDVYLVQQYFDVIGKAGNENFAFERNEVRKYAKLLKDAKAGLESKDATVRLETTSMLVTRYRTPAPGVTKTETVPAAESKKILTTLAKAEWKVTNPRFGAITAQNTFFLLGLEPKDGWNQPVDSNLLPTEAKKWLEANAGKFKMKRFVREADKKDDTEPE